MKTWYDWSLFYKTMFWGSFLFCTSYESAGQMDKALVGASLCIALAVAGWMPRNRD